MRGHKGEVVEKIVVLGAGQMGQGIAQVALMAGFQVYLYDLSPRALQDAQIFLDRALKKKNQTTENLYPLQDLGQMPEVDLFIEAVTEDFKIKEEIFLSLPNYPNAVYATNTSSISVDDLSQNLAFQDRFIGLHFMNPVAYMKLVEIIPSQKTSPETLKKIESFVGYLDKAYIISENSPGFVVNRLLLPMINEAIDLLSKNVASAEDIDMAMCLGANHPMGPLELADFIGLDTCRSILKVMANDLKNTKYEPVPLLEEMVSNGYLGRKSKKGFYVYE